MENNIFYNNLNFIDNFKVTPNADIPINGNNDIITGLLPYQGIT